MSNYYEKLVESVGEAKARERMKEIRAKRTAPSYFATLTKEEITAISSKGGKAKHASKDFPDGGASTDSAG